MFHDKDLNWGAEALVQQIGSASSAMRLRLQPQLTRMVDEMQKAGAPVPPKLRDLNEELLDEAIEAWFDNLPL
jgi:hypothetical protein